MEVVLELLHERLTAPLGGRLHMPPLGAAVSLIAVFTGLAIGTSQADAVMLEAINQESVDSGTVAVNGTHLFYEAAGSGPAVVLIEGANLDLRMWDPQFLPLARTHHVIRYDLRGYGRSGPADAPYESAADLYALLDALHVRRASLVGLSGGGRIAIDFALAHPGRVNRLVLVAPGLSGWKFSHSDTAYFADARRARDRGDTAALGLAWLESAYMRPAMEHPELVPELREMAAAFGKHWFAVLHHGDLERVADPPALHRTTELRMPTLLVVGTRDVPDIQEIADTLVATVPNLRRVSFKGAGHVVNLEQPARFTKLLLDFLKQQTLEACGRSSLTKGSENQTRVGD